MIALRKWLVVLPVLVTSIALLASVNPVAAEANSGSGEKIKLKSLISNHSTTIWRNLSDSYNHHAGGGIRLSSSTLGDALDFKNTDVVELALHDAVQACDSGDLNILPLNRIFSADNSHLNEIVPNGVQPCSLGHSIWATVITFKESEFDAEAMPGLVQDFFNTDAYPGKRALKKTPRALAEWALLDQGYPANQIYTAMAMEQAWEQVESSLAGISTDIVWVETDHQALELLDSGAVVFAAVSSQNLVRKIAAQPDSVRNLYGVIWNGAIAHMSMLGIPKESAAEGAMELLRYMTDPTRNVQMSTAIGYAPVQGDRTAFIEDRFLRALPLGVQLDNLVWGNSKWWREQGAEIEGLFLDFIDRTANAATALLVLEQVGS